MKIRPLAVVIAILALWPPHLAQALTATFDFDTGTPPLSAGQGTPLDQTKSGVSAHFSSPSDPIGQGYSVQNAGTTFWTLSLFSGNYLIPNSVFKSFLDIKFNQQLTAITLDFATADFQQVEIPSPLQITAYENSTASTPIGSATAQGTYAGDTMPMGVLTFNSGGKPFNLVELGLPVYPNGASDFLVDNITVTVLPGPTPTPTRTPLPTPTRTPSRTPTRTPTAGPSRTPTRTPSRTPTPPPSRTPTRTPSRTPTPVVSRTPTRTPSRTPTPPASRTPTRTPSRTPTPAVSRTPTRTPSRTPTSLSTRTPTRTPSRTPSRTPTPRPT